MSSNARRAVIAATVIMALVAIYFYLGQHSAPPPSTSTLSESPALDIDKDAASVPEPVTDNPVERPAPPEVTVAPPSPPIGDNVEVAFSGRVTDLHGKPISSASIILFPMHVSFQSDLRGIYKATVPTGMSFTSDGNYAIGPAPAGATYELIATHVDYSDSDRITVPATRKEINFTLRPLGSIEGRVVAARTGQPVTDFRIRPELEHDPAPTTLEAEFKRVRDDQGRFRLDRIKAGMSTISVGAKGFADTTVTFPPVMAGETRERVEVRLEPGAVLQGQVVDPNGQPLRMAQVSGGYPRRGAISNSNGEFRLDSLPAGPFEVTAKHSDYAPKTITINLGNGTVNRTRIVMTSGTILEGEFTMGGKGVPGEILVYVEREQPQKTVASGEFPSPNPPVVHVRAGEDGRFRIPEVPEGPLRLEGVLEISHGCQCTWRKTIKLTAREDTTHTVDIHFPANEAIVEGTVYVASGKSLVGFGSLYTTYADFTPEGETAIVVEAKIEQGRYSICLPSGRTGLWLHVDPKQPYDGPRSKEIDVDLKSGDHVARDIFLYGGATLQIRLSGPAVPQTMMVIALRGEIDLGETLTRESMASMAPGGQGMVESGGIVKLWGLEPGTYTLCAFDFTKTTESARVLASKVVNVEKDAKMNVELNVPEQ